MHPLLFVVPEPWSGAFARVAELGRGAGRGGAEGVVALTLVVAGWLLATLVSALVRALVRFSRLDDSLARLLGSWLPGRHAPSALAGWAAYWAVLGASALLALEAAGIEVILPVAARLSEVVPRIVTSALLFASGGLVATVTGAITARFLESAGVRSARLTGRIVGAVLVGFSALLALEQLGLAAQFVMALGTIAAGAAGLALALAFGLGCRELARDFLVEYLRGVDDDRPRGRP